MESGHNGNHQVVRVVGAPADLMARVRAALPERVVLAGPPDGATIVAGRSQLALIIHYAQSGSDLLHIAAAGTSAPLVIVSEAPSPSEALAALEAGADGYLDAAIGAIALRSALLGVFDGQLAYGRDVVGRWLRDRDRKRTAVGALLTVRQRQILELIARGATDKEIARAFGTRTSAIQKQVSRLLRRIGARNRAMAVAARDGGVAGAAE